MQESEPLAQSPTLQVPQTLTQQEPLQVGGQA